MCFPKHGLIFVDKCVFILLTHVIEYFVFTIIKYKFNFDGFYVLLIVADFWSTLLIIKFQVYLIALKIISFR